MQSSIIMIGDGIQTELGEHLEHEEQWMGSSSGWIIEVRILDGVSWKGRRW